MTQSHEFIRFAVETGVLKFGEFKTKAGRLSPYFFNAGLFNDGRSLGRLAGFYAERLLQAEAGGGDARRSTCFTARPTRASPWPRRWRWRWRRAAATFLSPSTARRRRTMARAACVIGAPLAGRVVIVDDVISAGTSVGESVALSRRTARRRRRC